MGMWRGGGVRDDTCSNTVSKSDGNLGHGRNHWWVRIDTGSRTPFAHGVSPTDSCVPGRVRGGSGRRDITVLLRLKKDLLLKVALTSENQSRHPYTHDLVVNPHRIRYRLIPCAGIN